MSKEKKLKQREKAFDYVFYIVLSLAVLVAIFYGFNFRGSSLSSKPEDWGVFGDYMGGTLNPLLAFFSFMLLLLNLKLQREQLDNAEEQLKINQEELKLTREELRKAADAQIQAAKVMNEQLKTQKYRLADNFFSLMFEKLSASQPFSIEACNSLKYSTARRNLSYFRFAIKNQKELIKYFRLLFQTFHMLKKILGDDHDKLNDFIKSIRSQQDQVILELLFIYISENREERSEFHKYLQSSNFFKHLKLDEKSLQFYEVLQAYDEFGFVDKKEFFKKIN